MSSLISKARQYLDYRRAFVGHRDAMVFRRLRNRIDPSRQPGIVRVRAFGSRGVIVRPWTMDPVTLWDVVRNGYHLPPQPVTCRTIVSLGANAGYTTAHYACAYPEARIVAVEMDSANAEVCRTNTAFARDRVAVVNAAIWSSDGVIEYGGNNVHDLHISSLSGHASTASRAPRQAPSMTVGTLFAKYELTQVDFLKMDIEGAEAAVFAGDLEWIARVGAILVEIHPPATTVSCRSILEREGFRVSQFQFDHETLFGIR